MRPCLAVFRALRVKVADIDAAIEQLTATRAENKEENMATIKDAQDAQTAIAQARAQTPYNPPRSQSHSGCDLGLCMDSALHPAEVTDSTEVLRRIHALFPLWL